MAKGKIDRHYAEEEARDKQKFRDQVEQVRDYQDQWREFLDKLQDNPMATLSQPVPPSTEGFHLRLRDAIDEATEEGKATFEFLKRRRPVKPHGATPSGT